MSGVEYREPRSLDETCALMDDLGEDGRLLAGGTALVLFMRQRLLSPAALINLRHVPELAGIRSENGSLVIGALTTHHEAAHSDLLRSQYPGLADTFARVATPRIRNAGTVGGNLAHGDPHLDPPVTLLALDASVATRSSRGERQIPLNELFLDYYETSLGTGEVLTSVRLPARQPGTGVGFIKFLPRSQDDYAAVDVAAWVRLDPRTGTLADARLALGSVGPVAFRAIEAEAVLRSQRPDASVLAEAGERAAAQADPEDDIRGSPAYKRELIRVLVGRCVRLALAEAQTHSPNTATAAARGWARR
jgi:aerobic carbon-monoxide dehydrogenase medium subunit